MEALYISIAVVAILAAIYVGLSAFVSVKLLGSITNPRGRTYDEARAIQSKDEKWDFNDYDNVWDKHDFEITTFDGLKLHGEYVNNPIKSSPAKVAIISHGHIGNIMQAVKYANIFYKKGYNLVMYDQRYFGKSEGYYSTLGQNETQDLSNIIDYTQQTFGRDAYIALHGESMGGATVLNVLAAREQDIQYVVADCPFSDSWSFCKELSTTKAHVPSFPTVNFANFLAKRKFQYDLHSVSPIKVVPSVKLPICYIHGTLDKLILPHHSEDLYKFTSNSMSELHLFEGAVHARSHLKDAKLYQTSVSDFIDKVDASLYTGKQL